MNTEKNMVAIKILQAIKITPRITAKEISQETGIAVQYIRNTLRILAELDLVTTPARGNYIITELGQEHIDLERRKGR